jgi:hypothetical protein
MGFGGHRHRRGYGDIGLTGNLELKAGADSPMLRVDDLTVMGLDAVFALLVDECRKVKVAGTTTFQEVRPDRKFEDPMEKAMTFFRSH